MIVPTVTLPKFNSEFSPEKVAVSPNRKPDRRNQASFFRGELLNFGGVSICYKYLLKPKPW